MILPQLPIPALVQGERRKLELQFSEGQKVLVSLWIQDR